MLQTICDLASVLLEFGKYNDVNRNCFTEKLDSDSGEKRREVK